MKRIFGIKKQTNNRFLNLYELDARFRDGTAAPYYVASRKGSATELRSVTHAVNPDGAVIYAVYGEQKDRIVLIRQYRYPVDSYVYEFPSGLVEPGEDPESAGIREFYEETGLTLHTVPGGDFSRGFFTSVGMTDESCCTIFGCCTGTPTTAHQEGTEDIEVILADRQECRRILREEPVAIMCAYHLMHFLSHEGDPLGFLNSI